MTIDTLSLEGKVAIVTGSGRENGIGAGIVRALARNGAAVVINYVSRSTTPRATAFADEVRGSGGRVIVVQSGVDTPEGAQHIVKKTLAGFETDHIDILVNNAGHGCIGYTPDIPPSELLETFQTNVFGPTYMVQAVIPHMPPGGRIINISSTTSKIGLVLGSTYGASKAAIDSLTYSWASELGRSKGITVNALAPGPVLTDFIPPNMEEELTRSQRDATRAADRPGTIEDVGDAVLLLASEKSRWITGQYISVSGGVTGP